jgi:hypothetical protein
MTSTFLGNCMNGKVIDLHVQHNQSWVRRPQENGKKTLTRCTTSRLSREKTLYDITDYTFSGFSESLAEQCLMLVVGDLTNE